MVQNIDIIYLLWMRWTKKKNVILLNIIFNFSVDERHFSRMNYFIFSLPLSIVLIKMQCENIFFITESVLSYVCLVKWSARWEGFTLGTFVTHSVQHTSWTFQKSLKKEWEWVRKKNNENNHLVLLFIYQ